MSAEPEHDKDELSRERTKSISDGYPCVYEGLPLPQPKQSIRLLRLIPNDVRSDTRLRGTLEVVNLADNPKYAALSYVWSYKDLEGGIGVDPKESVIHCNNTELRITRSCHDALTSLRDLNGSISIWIDAICINQKDEKEKVSQIEIMADIYTWAKTVYIWLGPGSSATERAIDALRTASNFRVYTPGIPWASDRPTSLRQDTFWLLWSFLCFQIEALFPFIQWMRSHQLRKIFSPQDLHELLDSKWAHRAWTYQEIVFSSNPVIVCGKKTLSWSNLQCGIDYLENPVPPYELLGIWLLKTAFSYAALTGRNGIQTTRSLFVTDQLERSFQPWKNMHRVWKKACRKTVWNNEKLRTLPDTSNAGRNSTWSVSEYQREFMEFHHDSFILGVVFLFIGFCLAMVGILFWSALNDFNSDSRGHHSPSYSEDSITLPPVESRDLPFLALVGAMAFAVMFWPEGGDTAGGRVLTQMLTGDLTRALREREATEAADKAFALHEVFNNLEIQISSNRADYQRPTGKVYRTLFLDLLRHQTSFINLLIDASGPETFSDVPSWVPDWRQTHKNDWNQSDFIYGHIEYYGTEVAEPQMKISKDKLGLWAVQKDVVRELSTTMYINLSLPEEKATGEEFAVLARSFARQISRVFEHASTSIPFSASNRTDLINMAIYKALTGMVLKPGDDQNSDMKIFRRWIELSKGPLLTTSALSSAFHEDGQLWPFMVRCYRYIHSKVIFVSAEGLYGTGPPGMIASDQIMWLKGVAIPMILRPVKGSGSEFKVIGPAVVPGLMDLSVFNGTDYGEKWEAIYLV